MSELSKGNNMSKSAIYNKAGAIIRAREFEQCHFIKCLEAGICPSCGEPLRTTGLTSEEHVLCICEKGCPLISPDGMDYSSLTCDIWRKCINNTIRKSAIMTNGAKKIPSVKKIYQKAVSLLATHEQNQKKFMSCLKAGICPNCGETLKIVHCEPPGDSYVICDRGCALIGQEGVNYTWITIPIWQDCINNSIRKIAVNT